VLVARLRDEGGDALLVAGDGADREIELGKGDAQ
jgi:hypothetical protein